MTLIGNDVLREIAGGSRSMNLSEEDRELLDDLIYNLESTETPQEAELAFEEIRNFNRLLFRKYGR